MHVVIHPNLSALNELMHNYFTLVDTLITSCTNSNLKMIQMINFNNILLDVCTLCSYADCTTVSLFASAKVLKYK